MHLPVRAVQQPDLRNAYNVDKAITSTTANAVHVIKCVGLAVKTLLILVSVAILLLSWRGILV